MQPCCSPSLAPTGPPRHRAVGPPPFCVPASPLSLPADTPQRHIRGTSPELQCPWLKLCSQLGNRTVAKGKSDLSSKIIASRWLLIKKLICTNGQEESAILFPAGCSYRVTEWFWVEGTVKTTSFQHLPQARTPSTRPEWAWSEPHPIWPCE